MTGCVIIEIFVNNKKGKKIEGNNLTMSFAGDLIAARLAGDPSALPITKIGWGISSTPTTPGDTDLENAFIKTIDNYTINNGNINFYYTLEETEYNGNLIREIGLFTDDNKLVARKVLEGIHKENLMRLENTWILHINKPEES